MLDISVVPLQQVIHDVLRLRFKLYEVNSHGTSRIENESQTSVHIFRILHNSAALHCQAGDGQRD